MNFEQLEQDMKKKELDALSERIRLALKNDKRTEAEIAQDFRNQPGYSEYMEYQKQLGQYQLEKGKAELARSEETVKHMSILLFILLILWTFSQF